MSSFAIQPITSSVTQSAAPATPHPAPAPTVPAGNGAQDTVKLSDSAQAAAMYRGGDSVSSISASLGVSVSIVDSYLGIVPAISVPSQVAAPTAHAATTQTASAGTSPGSSATRVDVKA